MANVGWEKCAKSGRLDTRSKKKKKRTYLFVKTMSEIVIVLHLLGNNR